MRKEIRQLKNKIIENCYYLMMRNPKARGWVHHDAAIQEKIINALKAKGITVIDLYIDLDEYRRYVGQAGYSNLPNYYGGGTAKLFPEKSLEHYVTAKLLDLSKEDIYIDIASASSPVSDIYHTLYGCSSYRQDLLYPEGLDGNIIGGDAAHIPVKDGFATKMALHCSLEHFEKESDIEFIKEASRILSRKGKLCIAPLYLFSDYAILVNPYTVIKEKMSFEKDAVLYCSQKWRNRHGRFYDVEHFVSRIYNNKGDFNLTIYIVRNEKEVDKESYCKFVALFEK
jgi:hypothetical protein